MAGVVTIQAIFPQRTGTSLAANVLSKDGTTSPRTVLQRLITLITGVFSGSRARFRMSIDDSTGVSATATITCTQASCTAGDKLHIGGVYVTAVTGAADPTLGQFSIDTSDAAVATSLGACINGYAAFRGKATATVSTNVVTVTRYEPGTTGNTVRLFKEVTTSGAFTLSGATFSGGRDPGDKQSLTATLAGALANNDVINFGSVTLTGKTSAPSGESQFLVGVDAPTDAAALIACINAHSKLKGLVLASQGATTSIVSIQLLRCGRVGALVSVTKTSSNTTLSAASFAPSTTEAYAAQQFDLAFGAL